MTGDHQPTVRHPPDHPPPGAPGDAADPGTDAGTDAGTPEPDDELAPGKRFEPL